MQKRVLLCSLLLLFTINGSFALGQSSQRNKTDPASEEIVLGVLKGPTAFSMARFMNQADQLQDIEVKFEVLNTPDVAVGRIIKGELDAALIPLNLASILYNRGMPYKLAATTGSGMLYIVGRGDGIQSLNDLKGKTLYSIGKGATPEYILTYLLNEASLTAEDVKVDYSYGPTDLAPALIDGLVDLALLPEPFVTSALSKSEDLRILIDLQDQWNQSTPGTGNYPMTGLFVKDELLQKKGVLEEVLNEVQASIQYALENKTGTASMVENLGLGLSADLASLAIDRLNIHYESARDAKENVLAFFKVLFKLDPASLGGNIPEEEFFYIPQ